eukprot:2082772-Rhodomonas_salina.1
MAIEGLLGPAGYAVERALSTLHLLDRLAPDTTRPLPDLLLLDTQVSDDDDDGGGGGGGDDDDGERASSKIVSRSCSCSCSC